MYADYTSWDFLKVRNDCFWREKLKLKKGFWKDPESPLSSRLLSSISCNCLRAKFICFSLSQSIISQLQSMNTQHLVQLISEHVPLSFNVGLILPFPSLHVWCSRWRRPLKKSYVSHICGAFHLCNSALSLLAGWKVFSHTSEHPYFFTEQILLMQSQTKVTAFILHPSFFKESRTSLVPLHLGLGEANFFSFFIQFKPYVVRINSSFLWTWSSWQIQGGTCFTWLQINPGTCIPLDRN